MRDFIKEIEKEGTIDLFEEMATKLLDITKGCRGSMHEPDEQDVYASFTGGDTFDNAGGSYEMGIVIGKTEVNNPQEYFSMASLVALARIGAVALLQKNDGNENDLSNKIEKLETFVQDVNTAIKTTKNKIMELEEEKAKKIENQKWQLALAIDSTILGYKNALLYFEHLKVSG